MTVLLKETPEQLILRVADSLQPAIRKTFLQAVEQVKGQVPIGRITELLEAGKLTQAVEALNIQLTDKQLAPFRNALQDAVRRTATATVAEFGLSFDVVNERAVRWATEQAGKLIVQIDNETRQAVADIVSKGLREGVAPRQQALLIRDIVGLTRRDAAAVDRFMTGAVESGMREASARTQAERMARRLLRRRAENIARTETMNAANTGARLGWEAAQDQGLLPQSAELVWIVTPDDRLCVLCAPMEGKLVRVGDPFIAEVKATSFNVDGQDVTVAETKPMVPITTQNPPLHASCRCALGVA